VLGSAACIIDIAGAKLRKRSRVGRLDAVLCALAPGALLTLLKRPADLTGKKGPTGALVAESSLFLNAASPSAAVWSGKVSRRATFAGAVQRYLTLARVNDVLATHSPAFTSRNPIQLWRTSHANTWLEQSS
jgi:hypothetical protein